jgi:hypothetical protein
MADPAEILLAARTSVLEISDWLKEAPEAFWDRVTAQRDAAMGQTLSGTEAVGISTSRGKVLAYNWILDLPNRLLSEQTAIADQLEAAPEGGESVG